MKNPGPAARSDLLLLSGAAGSADAAGFIGMGHVFISNMTGNLVLLGIDLGQGHLRGAIRVLYVLGMFIGGAALGSRLARPFDAQDWRPLMVRLLSVEALLLVLFAASWVFVTGEGRVVHFYLLIPLLAVAMGIQSAALNRLGIAGVTNSAVTGTLTSLIMQLEGRRAGTSVQPLAQDRIVWTRGLVLVLYVGGALVNALLMARVQGIAGIIPALLVLLVLARCLAHGPRPTA